MKFDGRRSVWFTQVLKLMQEKGLGTVVERDGLVFHYFSTPEDDGSARWPLSRILL